jgi:hypothetical protein
MGSSCIATAGAHVMSGRRQDVRLIAQMFRGWLQLRRALVQLSCHAGAPRLNVAYEVVVRGQQNGVTEKDPATLFSSLTNFCTRACTAWAATAAMPDYARQQDASIAFRGTMRIAVHATKTPRSSRTAGPTSHAGLSC